MAVVKAMFNAPMWTQFGTVSSNMANRTSTTALIVRVVEHMECPIDNTAADIKLWVHGAHAKLTGIIEPDFGLLDQLLSLGTLSHRQFETIRGMGATAYDMAEKLLGILQQQNTEAEYLNLLKALKESNQQHVVNYIQHKGEISPMCIPCGKEFPLDESKVRQIHVNSPQLIENMDPSEVFLMLLVSAKCINTLQHLYINEMRHKTEKNRRLLSFLARRSVSDYNNFVLSLKESDQPHLAGAMVRDGVLMDVAAELDRDQDMSDIELDRLELLIVDRSNEFLPRGMDEILAKCKLTCYGKEIVLIITKKGRSIHSFFMCATLEALQYLRRMSADGRLKEMLEKFFTRLSSSTVHIKRLTLSEEEYQTSASYFNSARCDTVEGSELLIVKLKHVVSITPEHIKAIQDEGLTVETFQLLKEQHLKQLGFRMGDCQLLLNWIASQKAATPACPDTTLATTTVGKKQKRHKMVPIAVMVSRSDDSRTPEECAVFISNSNLFIMAQLLSGQTLYGGQDRRIRIDIGRLLSEVQHGRKRIGGGLYGAKPPPRDKVWIAYREQGNLEVKTFWKNHKGKKKKVPTATLR